MKTSFPKILENNKLIIPILQRDYAQGRTDDKTNRIRRSFLDALFEVITKRVNNSSSSDSLELDFIYGFSKKENHITSFSPIDGQQRLTTLWLLWWFVTAREKVQGYSNLSNFRYETRHSTTVFCEKLVAFCPTFDSKSVSDVIRNQSWYFETWDYDPGIQGLLITLNDIEQRYEQLGEKSIWNILNSQNSPFYFYKLNMERVGLPDDLYIKMNSRGKPLTDFEYFKANFSEVIANDALKERFYNSIDQEWSEVIWNIVYKSEQRSKSEDLATAVDNCFMRLINFVTDVLAYKEGITISDITNSTIEVKRLYQQEDNLCFLFNVLDSIVNLDRYNPDFWNNLFYIEKSGFSKEKTRLFFQNSNVHLLEKCLFTYTKNSREFPFPEQLLLYSCMIQWINNTADFNTTVRIIRNLVANSSNELRVESIGENFEEIEKFVVDQNFDQLAHFKTDQIKEEREKQALITEQPTIEVHIFELEDSDLFRGCISIFDTDSHFIERKNCFLQVFDEDIIVSDFQNRANLLFCFGDYTQDDGDYTNILAKSKANWRSFLTTPAFNKGQLFSKTKPVFIECLDFFINHPGMAIEEKINASLLKYETGSKDWKYYFLKYPGFREQCNKGYYYWNDKNPYPLFKMKEKQFNGYHWDPFLLEVKKTVNNGCLQLDNGDKMQLIIKDNIYHITTMSSGFNIANITPSKTEEVLADNFEIAIAQSDEGVDIEDRIQKLICEINSMLTKSS